MRALVIYDSVFGNTEQVAKAIAEALATQASVDLRRAAAASPEIVRGVDLLVVGSPTRGFRPTEDVAGLLKAIPSRSLQGMRVAAFDTRFQADELPSRSVRFIVKTGGYAAKRIAGRLEKAGGALAAPPEGFYVEDTEGPMKAGELDRAADWARRLLSSA